MRLILILFILLMIGVVGIGVMAPMRLSSIQEQVLRGLHGNIIAVDEQSSVENCVLIGDQQRAVIRTHRTVRFGDGSTLEIIYREPLAAPNSSCQ